MANQKAYIFNNLPKNPKVVTQESDGYMSKNDKRLLENIKGNVNDLSGILNGFGSKKLFFTNENIFSELGPGNKLDIVVETDNMNIYGNILSVVANGLAILDLCLEFAFTFQENTTDLFDIYHTIGIIHFIDNHKRLIADIFKQNDYCIQLDNGTISLNAFLRIKSDGELQIKILNNNYSAEDLNAVTFLCHTGIPLVIKSMEIWKENGGE